MKCSPCTDEFGKGTINCTNTGAMSCLEGNYLSLVPKNEFITNQMCISCGDAIPNCMLCSDGTKCEKCADGYMVDDETG